MQKSPVMVSMYLLLSHGPIMQDGETYQQWTCLPLDFDVSGHCSRYMTIVAVPFGPSAATVGMAEVFAELREAMPYAYQWLTYNWYYEWEED